MEENEYFQKEFGGIAERTGFLVGRQEIETRAIIGDAAFEKLTAFNDAQAAIGIQMNVARVMHVKSVDMLIRSGAFILRSIPVLALGWSIFYWVH